MTTDQKIEILKLVEEVNKGEAYVSYWPTASNGGVQIFIHRTYSGRNIIKNKKEACVLFEDYATIIRVLGKMKEQTERI